MLTLQRDWSLNSLTTISSFSKLATTRTPRNEIIWLFFQMLHCQVSSALQRNQWCERSEHAMKWFIRLPQSYHVTLNELASKVARVIAAIQCRLYTMMKKDARVVMVSVIGNVLGDSSSNSRRVRVHFTKRLFAWEGYEYK